VSGMYALHQTSGSTRAAEQARRYDRYSVSGMYVCIKYIEIRVIRGYVIRQSCDCSRVTVRQEGPSTTEICVSEYAGLSGTYNLERSSTHSGESMLPHNIMHYLHERKEEVILLYNVFGTYPIKPTPC
jgi:hypothetical protein